MRSDLWRQRGVTRSASLFSGSTTVQPWHEHAIIGSSTFNPLIRWQWQERVPTVSHFARSLRTSSADVFARAGRLLARHRPR
jgi:hypothetical protein